MDFCRRHRKWHFKSVLILTSVVTFVLSCSLSLNINGPGDTPATPTSIQDAVNLAVERTLTALAHTHQENQEPEQATGDATQVAANVNTLVAQAVLTFQPTHVPIPPTRVPVRPTQPPVPPTATPPPPPPPTATPAPTATPVPTDMPTLTNTPEPTSTPLPTNTPTLTPTNTPTPTNTYTPTPIPTHCPTEYCIILQRCEPGENTRAVGTIYENDRPKNGVRVRVSYAMGGPPVIPDFISGNDPNNPKLPDPQHPGYYQLGLLEGGALEGNWWVFIVDDQHNVLSEGRYFKTHGQQTATSCQIAITDFYR